MISHKICKTKTIWLVCRTVFASLLHFHSMCKPQKILIHQQTLTPQARELFGMLSQSFYLLAPCVALAIKRIFHLIHKCHWYSSVRLSQSPCLHPDHVMQAEKEVPMLYRNSERDLPTLYVCPVGNVLERAPLSPCYMSGNTHPTIPYSVFQGGKSGGSKGGFPTRQWDRKQAV